MASHGKGIIPESPFKANLLKGQVALVVGGGTGICFDIALTLGHHGADIVLMGRREEVLKSAVARLEADGIKAMYFAGDVRKPESCEGAVKSVLDHFGKLNILVNGAAGNFLVPLAGMSPNAFKAVIDIDLIGTFNMCRASFEALKQSKGTIVNISATLHYGAVHFVGHAASAKAGIDSLTRSMALEWGEYGIRVNAVAPGWVEETEGFDRLIGDHADSFAQTIPIGRACTKRDIALSCLYLVSSAAATVTGAVLVVDGGNWLWRPKLISSSGSFSGHAQPPSHSPSHSHSSSSSHFKPTYKL